METAAIEVSEEVTAVATMQVEAAVAKVAEEAAAAAMVVAMGVEEVAMLARAEAVEADEAQAVSPLALDQRSWMRERLPRVGSHCTWRHLVPFHVAF